MTHELLNTRDTAKFLGISEIALRNARVKVSRDGHLESPPFYKIGRSVRYDIQDLREWLAQHRYEVLPAEVIR
jgi:predicted DNA-binding transcriptional regulator AlpA